MEHQPAYIVITPARNEEQFIELTLKSVISQTVRPIRWVIVSDGSTDRTDEIVRQYSAVHTWIELVRMPERRQRHFAGKVDAFNVGYAKVRDLQHEAVCSLDADISFGETYFSFLLQKLSDDSQLGLVGTPFEQGGHRVYDYRFVNIEHVSGACQVFRRQCFEDIGGYVPVKGGGIDHIAVVTARMKGWKTRTFTEQTCVHHRKIGTAEGGLLTSRFQYGRKDYVFGNHPLWELFRICYQMTQRPFVIGGVALLSGYLWARIRCLESPVSREFIEFYRKEQIQRLKVWFKKGRSIRHGARQLPSRAA